MTGFFALLNKFAASDTDLPPPLECSNSIGSGISISTTFVHMSRGILSCAGADCLLACAITLVKTSATLEGSRTSS